MTRLPFSKTDITDKLAAGSAPNRRRRLVLAAAVALTMAAAAGGFPRFAWAGAFDDFFTAVKMDDVDAVLRLLKRGFDPNASEPVRGETGLMLAAREGSQKVFEALLRAPDIDIERKALNGDTALMLASFRGNKAFVAALLAMNAEVNRPGWTPLHYAAASGSNDVVAMLLEKSAYIDAESPNRTTPIMMAALGGHILTVKLLLDEGADAMLKNNAGMTAIDIARSIDRNDIADGLVFRLKKAGKL